MEKENEKGKVKELAKVKVTERCLALGVRERRIGRPIGRRAVRQPMESRRQRAQQP